MVRPAVDPDTAGYPRKKSILFGRKYFQRIHFTYFFSTNQGVLLRHNRPGLPTTGSYGHMVLVQGPARKRASSPDTVFTQRGATVPTLVDCADAAGRHIADSEQR